jgi:D-alanyl-D-alanine carboxypeptidase
MAGGPPGAVAIVQRGNRRTVYTAGVADVRSRRRIRLGDRMRVASVAKAYSGAVALALVSRGRLRLDDTIGKRLPGLPRAWANVTLRQLLNHTSGLPDFSKDGDFVARVRAAPRKPLPPRRLLQFVFDKDLEFAPGSRYEYSNSDNIAVALMAAAATGSSYERQLRTLVLARLGLKRTSLPVGARLPSPYIHGYDVDPPDPPEDVSTLLAASLAWASGGIVSTPAELNRFVRAYAGGRLFGRRTRAQQLRFVRGSSEPRGPGTNSAGLAIFRYRTRCGTVYGHTGNTPGYTQFAAATRDGRRSVTVSINEQYTPALLGKLRRAEELAVCAALGR